MKKISTIIIIALCSVFCECAPTNDNKVTSACGMSNPQKNFTWLADLIEKAENDKTGNYIGTIWLERYQGDDIFVTNMAMGSGAIAFYYFDCEGNSFVPKTLSYMKFDSIVYTNVP